MATLTLKQIFQQTPDVAELIDSFNELVPGVPASSGDLECLLKDLRTKRVYFMYETVGQSAQGLNTKIEILSKKNIGCGIYGPSKPSQESALLNARRPLVDSHVFNNAIDGLSECLAFAKDVIHRYHSEGICPSCCTDLRIVLKAPKMPRCPGCMVAMSIGMRP